MFTSGLTSPCYSIVCLRGCHWDLCQRLLLRRGKATAGTSDWPELGGAATAGYDIAPPSAEEARLLLFGSSGLRWDQAEPSLWAFRAFFNRLNSPWRENQFLLPTRFNQHSKKRDFLSPLPQKNDNRIFLNVASPPWVFLPGPSLYWLQMSHCCVEWGLQSWKGPWIQFLENIFMQMVFTSRTTSCKMPLAFDEPFIWGHLEKWILWVLKVHVFCLVRFISSPRTLVMNAVTGFFLSEAFFNFEFSSLVNYEAG